MTQQDGPSQPDTQSERPRERRRPAAAEADRWRDEGSEYVPARRAPVVQARDPEVDFDLDEPSHPSNETGPANEMAVEPAPKPEPLPRRIPGANHPARSTARSSTARSSTRDTPDVIQAVQTDTPSGNPWADVAEPPIVDDEIVEPAPESSGVGGAVTPYTRPPRVTRRQATPAPRRVSTSPPAILTAPTPAPSHESHVDSPEAAGPSPVEHPRVAAPVHPHVAPRPPAQTRAPRTVRRNTRAWIGLPALLVLLLGSAFVAWVSAEPFWLDAGHGTTGIATVVSRTDRCRVTFAAVGGGFTTSTVDLAGADLERCAPGSAVPAQMVSADAARAYVVDRVGLRLRWGVGLGVLLLCGVGIAWATGATRFRGLQRIIAISLSLAAPGLVALTMLAIAY